jgi:gallate decarboxylase subunit D
MGRAYPSGERMDFALTQGHGRSQVSLQAFYMGPDLVVRLFNGGSHLGAVAVGEYHNEYKRASVSVLTRFGHKDNVIAYKAAHLISHSTQKPVCVIAGVHVDDITADEINQIVENTDRLVQELIARLVHDHGKFE